MPKTLIKGNLRSGDYLRAIITDTAPFEVPLVFSNDGLYKNYIKINKFKTDLQSLIYAVLNNNYTIPYRYNIVKTAISARQLSLLHPSSQVAVCKFYEKYEELICYYATTSSFTIRAPERIGSTFYFSAPTADRNKYKRGAVDTTDLDKFTRNPASYFAYRGYDRLYKFFDSTDFLRIEKKYSRMVSLDVAKCFDSVYTHSIAWAVKDMQTAKGNLSSNHFGSDFDSLMQKMNYNETNGICIGAEVSRIFAEIIFSKVDCNIESKLATVGLVHGSDYEIRRYVDNYYVFINSEEAQARIIGCISQCLREYKFHLNEGKAEYLDRPFYTKKSRITDDTNRTLKAFFDKFIDRQVIAGRAYFFPTKIFNYNSLMRHAIKEIKANCYNAGLGYEAVANYVIPSFGKRLISIVDDQKTCAAHRQCDDDDYLYSILMLAELSFFFYTMNPTVASSLSVSRTIIIAARFLRSFSPERLPFFQERVAFWTVQLLQDPRLNSISKNCDAIPIEILNILIAMHDAASDHTFNEDIIAKIFSPIDKLGYFSIITFLFIAKDLTRFNTLRAKIYRHIKVLLKQDAAPSVSAHHSHLLLDVLSCPYLSLDDRISLYHDACRSMGLPKLSNDRASAAVRECEGSPWFVSWTGVELLNMIRKKELSAVY